MVESAKRLETTVFPACSAGAITFSTSSVRAARKSRSSVRGCISFASGEEKLANTLAHRGAARVTRVDDILASGELFLEKIYQRVFSRSAPTFKYDEFSSHVGIVLYKKKAARRNAKGDLQFRSDGCSALGALRHPPVNSVSERGLVTQYQ